MSHLSKLSFSLDKSLSLPPLSTYYVKCTPCEVQYEEISYNPTKLPFENGPIIEAKVSSANLISEGEDVKTIIEFLLDIDEYELSYLPGDSIGILPENPEDEVERVLKRLNISDFSCKIEINDESQKKKTGLPSHLPSKATSRFLFKKCLDMRAIVKKSLLRSLIGYTSEEEHKRRLAELCSKEGIAEYREHILAKRCSIVDLLEALPSCHPPLSLLLQHVPPLQPRPYSIASSPLECPGKLRIVFNVVYDGNNRKGICSGWLYSVLKPFIDVESRLNSLNLNESSTPVKVLIYLRKSTQFRIPENPSIPLMMIGTGTGVAPFLGFLEHRRNQLLSNNSNLKQANWLLFGCRYPKKDEIYRNTFKKYNNESLCEYLVCFSRAGSKDITSNKYVQDILNEKKDDIVSQLVTTETCLFICGNGVTMGKQVLQMLINCFKSVQGMTEEEAKVAVAELESCGRILTDIWV